MTDKIGGRPPGGQTPNIARKGAKETGTGASKMAQESTGSKGDDGLDRFERAAAQAQAMPKGAAAQQRTQTQAPLNKAQFSSAELEYLFTQVAVAMSQLPPKANRSRRGKAFVDAVLKKNPHLAAALGDEGASAIGAAIDGSPVFAQTLDDITDEASKLKK